LCVDVVFRLFFFFSSRRRHTRFSRDWSSDVCSSDLLKRMNIELTYFQARVGAYQRFQVVAGREIRQLDVHALEQRLVELIHGPRSEERRVGKECRSRRSPEHRKKNKGEVAYQEGEAA